MTENIYQNIPEQLPDELFQQLAGNSGVTIERILSRGQSTPEGEWLCEARHEWVILLQGEAELGFAGGASEHLLPGDYFNIPAGTQHRVCWTAADVDTVWLAVHYPG